MITFGFLMFAGTVEMRQKGESQNKGIKKTKHVRFPKKRTFRTP